MGNEGERVEVEIPRNVTTSFRGNDSLDCGTSCEVIPNQLRELLDIHQCIGMVINARKVVVSQHGNSTAELKALLNSCAPPKPYAAKRTGGNRFLILDQNSKTPHSEVLLFIVYVLPRGLPKNDVRRDIVMT